MGRPFFCSASIKGNMIQGFKIPVIK